MSRNNISGAFERALERWHFGAMHACSSMGRGAFGPLRTVDTLFHKANRARFYKDGNLVAFPGLDLMALLSGMNEKTLRRHLDRLEKAGWCGFNSDITEPTFIS